MLVVELDLDFECIIVVLLCLSPLVLLLGYNAQLVIDFGLLISIIEFNFDFECIIVVLNSMCLLMLFLGYHAQLVISSGL